MKFTVNIESADGNAGEDGIIVVAESEEAARAAALDGRPKGTRVTFIEAVDG